MGAGIRRDKAESTEGEGTCDVHVLTSDGHEYLDYTEDEKEKVAILKAQGMKNPELRKVIRKRENGLLILYPIGDVEPLTKTEIKGSHKTPFGFAIVFPDRKGFGDIKSYRVNDMR